MPEMTERVREIFRVIRLAMDEEQSFEERDDQDFPAWKDVGDHVEVRVAFDIVDDQANPVLTGRRTGDQIPLVVVEETWRSGALVEYRYGLEDAGLMNYYEGFHLHPEPMPMGPVTSHHQISADDIDHWQEIPAVTLASVVRPLLTSYYRNRGGPVWTRCFYCADLTSAASQSS